VDNLEYMLNWSANGARLPIQPGLPADLNEKETIICQALEKGPLHIDDLSIRTQIPLAQIASLLLELEFKDCIRTLPGKQFALAWKTT
jgi:DNA processing protein